MLVSRSYVLSLLPLDFTGQKFYHGCVNESSTERGEGVGGEGMVQTPHYTQQSEAQRPLTKVVYQYIAVCVCVCTCNHTLYRETCLLLLPWEQHFCVVCSFRSSYSHRNSRRQVVTLS